MRPSLTKMSLCGCDCPLDPEGPSVKESIICTHGCPGEMGKALLDYGEPPSLRGGRFQLGAHVEVQAVGRSQQATSQRSQACTWAVPCVQLPACDGGQTSPLNNYVSPPGAQMPLSLPGNHGVLVAPLQRAPGTCLCHCLHPPVTSAPRSPGQGFSKLLVGCKSGELVALRLPPCAELGSAPQWPPSVHACALTPQCL